MSADNKRRLAEIMREGNWDAQTIARLLRYSPHTVVSWLRPETSGAFRHMPDRAMHMLEIKLSIKKHTGQEPD